jgi:hypothetical protein
MHARLPPTRPLRKSLAISAVLVASGVVAACSSSPATEPAQSAGEGVSAGVAPPLLPLTKYDFTIDHIDVVYANEPPEDFTFDTGFQYWGELGVKTFSSNPAISSNPAGAWCSLGPGGAGTVLRNCGKGGMLNGGPFTAGAPLTAQVTVGDPADKVYVGFAFDNIESASPAGGNPALQQSLAAGGDFTQTAGGTLSLAGALAESGTPLAALGPWGAAIAMFGAAVSTVGDIANPATLPKGGVAIDCAGGLMNTFGFDDELTIGCQDSRCSFARISDDTAFFAPKPVQGVTQQQSYFTPQDLAEFTAYGPVSLELDVTEREKGTAVGAGDLTGSYACSSSHRIFLTIAREWNSGLAPSSKSGDGAAAMSSTEIDAFWPDTAWGTIDRRWTSPGGTQLQQVGKKMPLTSSTPIASISRTPQNMDAFWVDETGALWTAYWWNDALGGSFVIEAGGAPSSAPPHATLSAVARTPGNLDVLYVGANGAIYDAAWSATGTWGVHPISGAGVASPGGGLAAVARNPTGLDVFYVSTSGATAGALMWTTSADGGTTWSVPQAVSAAGVAKAGASVAAVAPLVTSLDAFFVGTNGALYQASWSPNLSWSTRAVSSTGIAPSGASVSAASRFYTSIDVAFLGNTGALYWGTSSDATSLWSPNVPWTFAKLPSTSTNDGGVFALGQVSLVANGAPGAGTTLDAYYESFGGRPVAAHWASSTNAWTVSFATPYAPVAPPTCTSTMACDTSSAPLIQTVACSSSVVDYYLHDSYTGSSSYMETGTTLSRPTDLITTDSIVACPSGTPISAMATSCASFSTYAPKSSWCGPVVTPPPSECGKTPISTCRGTWHCCGGTWSCGVCT